MNNEEKERYTCFCEPFDYCGSEYLQLNDFYLEGAIYEDYACYYTNLVEENINWLLFRNLISEELSEKAKKVYNLSVPLMEDENVERSADFIRTSKQWQAVFLLVDQIREELIRKGVVFDALERLIDYLKRNKTEYLKDS